MPNKIWNFIKYLNAAKSDKIASENERDFNKSQYTISKSIEVNLKNLKSIFGKSDDIIFREFKIDSSQKIKAFICFVDGLVNSEVLNDHVIKALMVDINITKLNTEAHQNIVNILKENVLSIIDASEITSFNIAIQGILSGRVILFIDGCNTALDINSKKSEARAIEEPVTETTVRGSREGFTETLRVNTSMLRKRIKNPNLIFENFNLGAQTNTNVSICYIEGIVNKQVLEKVKNRLSKIDTDAILESGYIEQFIEDHPLSPFPTIGNSEKPDKVAGKLLEGRVAILCDGTPFVLTVPYLYIESFQSSEDYYSRPYYASFIRLVRLLAYAITLAAPALFIAITTFHQEMVSPILILSITAGRESTPFPVFIEVLIMQIMLELIRESSIRTPRSVGQTVGIVGTLVVGEAAVQSGLIGYPMVIMSSLTVITSFIITPIYDSIVIFKYFLIILSSIFGLYGFILGLMIMLMHVCSLNSFGIPYFSPIAPANKEGLKDTFIRAPLWLMNFRPKSVTQKTSNRQNSTLASKESTSKSDGGGKN